VEGRSDVKADSLFAGFGVRVMGRLGVGEPVLGGAVGRGGLVEGGRGAEIASFGVGEVGIGRDRFVWG
jgi:hypothetical protein